MLVFMEMGENSDTLGIRYINEAGSQHQVRQTGDVAVCFATHFRG